MACAIASSSRSLPFSSFARRPSSRTRLAYSPRRPLSGPSADIGSQLRAVMRDVPQPVSIAVARVHPPNPPSSAPNAERPAAGLAGPASYRGTTLSSLTSLTLHPHPLVAFSLRLPSRMADCLRPRSSPSSSSSSREAEAESQRERERERDRRRVTVSLLSTSGESMAESLSRPFTDQSGIFSRRDEWDDGDPPGVKGSVGILRCEVVSSLPLADLFPSADPVASSDPVESSTSQGGSELFICRVLEVVHGTGQPLVHHQRKYKSMPQDPPDDPDAHD